MQMLSRDRFNSRARSIECAYPAGAVAAFHAEMILQRLDRDRARKAPAIDPRRKYHREIRVAIRRRIGGKKDVHGGLEWQGNGKEMAIMHDPTRGASMRSTLLLAG